MRKADIAWIVANQLGRRNLTPSQRAALALELEKQLSAEAKTRMVATQNNRAGRATQEKIPEQDKGQARDKAAAMVGANRYEAKLFSILADHFSRRMEKLGRDWSRHSKTERDTDG